MPFNLQERIKYLNEKTGNLKQNLASFIDLGKQLELDFDFSLASLNQLEMVLLKLAPDFDQRKNMDLYEDCWLYLGETYRKALNGKWQISDDEEYNPTYYNLPVITDFNAYSDELCPMIIIDVFMKNKTRGLLKDQADRYQHPVG